MRTYVFPGQGSQVRGMGEGLFEQFPEITRKADEILGYSIQTLCLDDPEGKLRLTQYTQPALYVVNALTYMKQQRDGSPPPDYVAGHSLGEYNALLAAGGFDFETGLRLVKKRGELMSKASGGAMAAVVGLNVEQIEKVLQNNGLDAIDIANLNTAKQIVISGNKNDIDRARDYFEREGADYIPLNVSAAFHSRYMQQAKEEYEQYLRSFTYSSLKIPVIANVTARPYEPDDFLPILAEQLRSSVKWRDSIYYLLKQGEMEFIELGPGKVLTRMIAKIQEEFRNSAKTENRDVSLEELSAQARNWRETSQSKEVGLREKTVFQQKIEAAAKRIEEWNKKYPIGTRVKCKDNEQVLTTRTEAMLLFGHRAAIYVENYNGYFALEDLIVIDSNETNRAV